ncbi:NVEALA domain-containing protein [Parabacteroides pacaensis]|uniref:NVEALA domain-containing protein n=1 Tax=Parabacteroides pacaensis TaxID=2086575 RepID=UPI000D0F85DC|nr:NVEALA domain-containing protein [Parabacteroides pacaensis]
MKKITTIKVGMISIVLVIVSALSFFNKEKEDLNRLALNNVEALAAEEGHTLVTVGCVGTGDIVCPIEGNLVMDYVIFYNL